MRSYLLLLLPLLIIGLSGCTDGATEKETRQYVDSVGFASHKWQVDSIISRTERLQPDHYREAVRRLDGPAPLKVAISPHDDYGYVGYLYPALFSHIHSKVVIIFGVGHKARTFGIENRLVFGSYGSWKSPGGEVIVSPLQKKIMLRLNEDMYTVNDSLQAVEHSIEALVPFLEHYSPGIEIIPVIVPAMPFERMEQISAALSVAIAETMGNAGLEWGTGWSIVISTDAVHYGNTDWGGKNYDRFGVDSAGYRNAVSYEEGIMNGILSGDLNRERIREFSKATVSDADFREYTWTWCGRYSVPLGLLTALDIAESKGSVLSGTPAGYSTSVAIPPLPVGDLGMGFTAPASLTHWVGYAAIGYR